MNIRDIHNQAMENLILAAKYANPANPEANQEYYLKAFELEHQAAQLALEDKNATDLTWSTLCRSAAWIAIEAKKYNEAEKIALTALARGAYPEEKPKLYEALFAAVSKQGFLQDFLKATEQKEPELATV